MAQTVPIEAVGDSPDAPAFAWERAIVYGAVIAASALAWVGVWVFAMDHAAVDGGVANLGPGMEMVDQVLVWAGYSAFPPGSIWSEICRAVIAGGSTDTGRWTIEQSALVLAMWMVMAVGMMLPTAAPVIAAYSDINQAAAAKGLPSASTAVFASGYVLVWAGLGVGVTMLQWFISDTFATSASLLDVAPVVGAVVLIMAGLYQWSALKEACLSQCRSPMKYFLLHWHEGKTGAVRMGMQHGLYCAGCCWALMAIMFVGGTMNVVWMAILSVIMLVEKILPKGQVFGQNFSGVIGVALVVWGLSLITMVMS